MNWKNWTLTFLLAIFVIFSVPNNLHAESLGFYSKIDDAGENLANSLTKRHLEDFSSFRNFWQNCRGEVPWLDTQPIDQEMLEDLENGDIRKLTAMAKTPLSTDDFEKIASCLKSTYADVKNRAQTQQKTLEESASIGLYMDGDTRNSDFDIVADIEKINEIIFATPDKYDGTKNATSEKLADFLNGKIPSVLGGTEKWNSENTISNENTTTNEQNIHNNTNTHNIDTKNNNGLGQWAAMCTPNGITSTAVNNMMTDDFLKDLNATLGWKNTQNTGADYSEKIWKNNNTQNSWNQTSENNSDTKKEKEDFTSKLPCNGIFCITIGSNIGAQNLLSGGKGGNSIEDILDKHIKKTEEISWSDLSAQKMTNNSFQLPFLNIKFSRKVAGGAVFIHNSPQISKTLKDEQTPQKEAQNFNEMYRCAMLEAGLSTDEKKNASILGASFLGNEASNTENAKNLVLPTDPQDALKLTNNTNCSKILKEEFRKKHYSGFSTQVNEISAFTAAMLDIINQILDTEKKLDTIPVQ